MRMFGWLRRRMRTTMMKMTYDIDNMERDEENVNDEDEEEE